MQKLIIFISIMALSSLTRGQSPLYFGLNYQLINAENLLSSKFKPIGFNFGYNEREKLIGVAFSMNYNSNTYERSEFLTEVNQNSTFSNDRDLRVRNSFLGLGLGPQFQTEISSDAKLKLTTSFHFGKVFSKANYADTRNELMKLEDGKFETTRTTIINSQERKYDQFTSFIRLSLGIDIINPFGVGFEAGYQTLDFGKSMNNLNPNGIYQNETFNTKTDMLFAGFILYLGKKEK